jgi:hypothetical protein
MTRGHGGHGGIDDFGGHQPARTSYFAVKAALLPRLATYCGEDSWQVSRKRDRQVLISPAGEDFTDAPNPCRDQHGFGAPVNRHGIPTPIGVGSLTRGLNQTNMKISAQGSRLESDTQIPDMGIPFNKRPERDSGPAQFFRAFHVQLRDSAQRAA